MKRRNLGGSGSSGRGSGKSGSGRQGRGSGRRRRDEDEDEDEDDGRRRGRGGPDGKKKDDSVMIIGIVAGVFVFLLLAVVMLNSGGGGGGGGGGDETPGERLKIVDTDTESVRSTFEEGKSAYKEAVGLEGSAKVSALERALRKLTSAGEMIEERRRKVPNPQARGPGFNTLDQIEEQLGQTKIMVRKALLEEKQ